MKSIKENDFFARKSEEVARDLLGKFICRKNGDTEERFMITESEAYYHDEKDEDGKYFCYGVHKTKVNEPLYDIPGTWCIYDGLLLLSVTNENYPDNVLIRSIKDESGTVYGPNAFAYELHLYQKDPNYCGCHGQFSLADDAALYLADGKEGREIVCNKRVNIKNSMKYNFQIEE